MFFINAMLLDDVTPTGECVDYAFIDVAYRTHVAMVRGRARSILRDARLADDITQDVFVRYIRYRQRGGDERETAAFLFRTTTNLALNHIRNRKRRRELLQQQNYASSTEPHVVDRLALEAVLEQVDETQAQVAVYYYIDGMEQQEIADVTGMQRRTVGRVLERFRKHARKIMQRSMH